MKVTEKGIDEMQRSLSKYTKALYETGRKTLYVYGNKMASSAQKDHRYNRKSGNLDKSIESIVSLKGLHLKFWINPVQLIVGKKKKYNYGVIQHEGSGKGYKKSKFAKRYPRKSPKTGYGVRHDHFMVRAWNKHFKKMVRELRKDMKKAAKKVRLQ